MMGTSNLAALNCVNIYTHDFKAFAFAIDAEKGALWCACCLASDDHTVVTLDYLFNSPVQVGDQLRKAPI